MKRWLIIQADREIGPYGPQKSQFLRECYSLKYAVEANGHYADIWGLRHKNYNNKPNFNDYDFIFLEEQYEFDWIPWDDIANSSAITLQLAGEVHVHQQFDKWSNMFDVILHPFKKVLYEKIHIYPDKKHIWYPSAMDGRYYINYNLPKQYNIIWMGNSTRAYIQDLIKDVGLVVKLEGGWDYIRTLASSKVSLNRRENIDINYKAFEAIGVGTALITDYDDQYVELGFKDGVNCFMYKDYKECVDKIKFMLEEDRWIDIGKAGYEISREHTYEARIKRLINILDGKQEGINYYD